jgi:opacity protein-like surface antigen
MLRKTLYGTLAASLLLVSASTAQAQFASPIRFSVHAGAALPMSDAADFYDLGFRVGAGLELRPPLSPIGFRLEGAFDRLSMDQDYLDALGAENGHASIWSITANGVLSPAVSPLYFIGGVGFYSGKETAEEGGISVSSESETDFGFNLGAGFQLPLTGFSAFIEGRWHRINVDGDDVDYIPVVFGIRF